MTIKPDSWIRKMALEHGMIEPFTGEQIRMYRDEHVSRGVISYGLSSYGYDIRVADEFKIFTNVWSTVVDPKHFDPRSFVDVSGVPYVDIPPNSFVLARSVEFFRIPRNVLAIVLGKSTYARCGVIANFTPLEPGWRGYITIELSNSTPLPARIYANEGIAQAVFFESDEDCEISYDEKNGKYNQQIGVTGPLL